MESANFHHQQQQDHQSVLDSSCYGLSWSQNPILNSSGDDRELKQDLERYAPCHDTSTPIENLMTHELQRAKEELFSSSESYPEMINNSPTSSIEDLHLNPSPGYNINNQELFLTNFSNGYPIKGGQIINPFPDDSQNYNHYQNRSSSRWTFSQIFPTINISNSATNYSFDMNLPALDLFGSPRNFSHPSSFVNPHQFGSFFKDTYGLDQMHQPNQRQVSCPSKISSACNTRTNSSEAKRPATTYMDTKFTESTVLKKSKLESRTSCAPFKVRKEKLGDRIAAIQQLVAPFGKTDTASVLMEAIGYINFLQTQVETLSVPYMKSANKTNRPPRRVVPMADGNEETKKDLKSRGLCLVPLSCLSYVTDGGGGVWPAP